MKLQVTALAIINIVAFTLLLYFFDIFGVINYYTIMRTKVEPVINPIMSRFVKRDRIEDSSLLQKYDLEKMRESFILREKDLESQEQMIISRTLELESQEKLLEEDKNNLLIAWSNYQAKLDERSEYETVLTDLANKVGAMPPANSVALLNQLAEDGSDDLVIDVLLQMDANAATAGTASITSYLISLMQPQVSARLLSKYEKRSSPSPKQAETIGESEFPSYNP